MHSNRGSSSLTLQGSPFGQTPGGHRYEGQFRYDSQKSELARRDGRDFNAIVFHLVRVRS